MSYCYQAFVFHSNAEEHVMLMSIVEAVCLSLSLPFTVLLMIAVCFFLRMAWIDLCRYGWEGIPNCIAFVCLWIGIESIFVAALVWMLSPPEKAGELCFEIAANVGMLEFSLVMLIVIWWQVRDILRRIADFAIGGAMCDG